MSDRGFECRAHAAWPRPPPGAWMDELAVGWVGWVVCALGPYRTEHRRRTPHTKAKRATAPGATAPSPFFVPIRKQGAGGTAGCVNGDREEERDRKTAGRKGSRKHAPFHQPVCRRRSPRAQCPAAATPPRCPGAPSLPPPVLVLPHSGCRACVRSHYKHTLISLLL